MADDKTKKDKRDRSRVGMVFAVAAAMYSLAGCQSNTAGKPGYVPSNCAMPGASCDSGR